jgi:ubiquinone/menaquinone biosynthesis C-methylase UbiE
VALAVAAVSAEERAGWSGARWRRRPGALVARATAGTVRKLLDPACGTGGMLTEAQRYLREHNT